MELILILLSWLLKDRWLKAAGTFFNFYEKKFEDLLFYTSYSLESNMHKLLYLKWCYRLYQLLLSLLFSSFMLGVFGLSRTVLFALLLFFSLFGIAKVLSVIQNSKSRLIQDLSSFIFYYELYLMQGENQLRALQKSTKYFPLLRVEERVQAYMDQFQELFYYTKWLVVKRFVILVEKGSHFTQRDMSMEFAQISDELFSRHYQDKKLQAEKVENLILLPMIIDLLIMVFYLLSPFLGEILGG